MAESVEALEVGEEAFVGPGVVVVEVGEEVAVEAGELA